MKVKSSKWLEVDFAKFLGLDRVMTPIEIDEATDRLNDELFSRTEKLTGDEITNAAVAVKREFVLAYLQDLLDNYSTRTYNDAKKIEIQFRLVRNLREILTELNSEQPNFEKTKTFIDEINRLLVSSEFRD